MRERGEVYLSDRIVEEEWSFRLHVALHKSDAALGRLAVERTPGVEVERLHLARRLSGLAFPDVGRFHRGGVEIRHGRGLRFITGHGDAVPFVEALIGGRALFFSQLRPPRCHLPYSAVA